ncbi:DUF4982 domain-containing protein [Flavobacterium sp. Sd200]|uniref:sugar-binding domain-containing protein n=1 Tax=Flavobacterium sp. Sd200 TaxID=2692211 RepID=UPI00136E3F58|nr:sugar-binding domain-containing protein [Flavobacterium sp. Sd200]MXN90904.1 DUF4982 domain-containing protein [Flavobacterium sp. Sd200]
MNRIKYVILLALTLVSANLLYAQSSGRKTNFDFDWKFKLGDYPDAQQQNFDDSGWRSLSVPHDWSIEGNFDAKHPMGNDGGYLPAGIGWYRKTFTVEPSQKDKKLSLYFEGVYMNAEVFVNGTSLGIRPYGYSSFYYDVTPYIKIGQKNTVAVRVDNSQQKNCRWYSGSGIYRHVWLISTNPVHVAPWGVAITTPQAEKKEATVSIKVNLQNETAGAQKVQVAVRLYDKNNKLVGKTQTVSDIAASTKQQTEFSVAVKSPNLWSPDTPNLYRAVVQVLNGTTVIDEVAIPFGIKKAEYSAEKVFVLNGHPTLINGGCVHHDNGPLGAAAYDRAEFKKVELLKEAGFNAIRTSHNPPSEAFLQACDELGLMVIDESFDGWREKKNTYDYSLYIDKWWQEDIRALVERDRNHPSIIMWSIGNEIIERKSLDALQTAFKFANLVRKIDPSRPVTSAMTTWDKEWEIFDPLFALHDIGGYNYQMHKAASDHERVPSRIIVQTESYPREAFKNWTAVNDNPYIIGDFVWTAMDYLGESGIGRYYYEGDPKGEHWERDLFPWHGAYCGDVDLIGWRKPISHYRSMLYNDSEKLYLAVKEPNGYYGEIKETLWSVWPTWKSWNWPGHEGKSIDVEVYSKYPSVRLYQDGKLVDEKPTTRNEEFKAVFSIPYQSGQLKAVGVVNGKEVENTVLKSAGQSSQIKLTADRTVLKANGQDLSYITVTLTDAEGNIQPNAENDLTFEINGAGTIVGTANANLKDTDSYVSAKRKAWKGQALVIVKTTQYKGDIELTVTSPTIKTAKVTLSSK